MSLSKLFTNWLWRNKSVSKTTPLKSTNLQKINDAVDGIDDRVIALDDSLTELAANVSDLDDKAIRVSGGTFNASVTLYGAGRLGISTDSNLILEGGNVNIRGNVDVDDTLYVGGENVYYDGTNFKVNVPAYLYETMRTGDTYLGVTKAAASVYIGSGYRPYFYVNSIRSNITSQHGTTISAGDEDDTLVNDIDIVNYGGDINLTCAENSNGDKGKVYYNGSEIATKDNLIYFKSMQGTGGTAGYIKVCNITLTGSWLNSPLTILFARRKDNRSTELNLRFNNFSSTSVATIDSFTINGPCKECYINGSGASWDIYIKKNENYDYIDILDFWVPKYLYDGITITWYDTQINSAISGWTQATDATTALKSDFAISWVTLLSGVTIASGSEYSATIAPTKSGYTPVGILGHRVGGTNASYCNTSQLYIDDSTSSVIWTCRNIGSSSATSVGLGCWILWQAN